jgi:tRNA A-37 threonylcarbamoyl transferase component Bud32
MTHIITSKFDDGLSGCKLKLLSNTTLRKYSSSEEYNSRLLKQVDKQNFFYNLILKNIDTPKVLNVNKENLCFFDMEYVPGLSSYDFFSSARKENIDFVIETLFGYFDYTSSRFKMVESNIQILDKIQTLKENSSHKNFIEYLENLIQENPVMVPNTFCHGDLTFSNILFHPNRLFFIDFLDCYVDSFLCDLIKIKQDLYYHWSLKVQNLSSVRVIQTYRYIWEKLEDRYEYFIHRSSFDVLDAMNILRIEPYLTNSHQQSILNKVITSTKLYEEFNHSYGREII